MEVCELPDDEFDQLYAEELALINQHNHESQLIDEYFADTEKITPQETSIGSHKQFFNKELSPNASLENEQILNHGHFQENEVCFDTVRKRLLQDDPFEEEILKQPKRKKTVLPCVGYAIENIPSFDPDLIVIERIVSHRKFSKHSRETCSENQIYDKTVKKCMFHRRIPNGDFQSITAECGNRIYLEVTNEEAFEETIRREGDVKRNSNLLSQSYRDLRMEAEKELMSMNSRILCANEDIDMADDDDQEKSLYLDEGELWVNKYKPRNYLDLLSDEFTNRSVLHWVKLWDKVVFGRASKKKTQVKLKVETGKSKFNNKFSPEIIEELDEDGRPKQKAILLCGAPGLGKTTLANIIARHAGYNVVEMNASDDRSVETFRTNLENSTTMKSVFGGDKRPNCLIIDEIDGAPAPSINLLVSLLQGKDGKTEKSKKKRDKFTLCRPVICICNDLYAPSLRPLKQISLIIQFPSTQSTKLAQRLLLISRKQRMKADLSVLLALCNKTENDIRSCLSFLQFMRVRSESLRLSDLEGMSIGQKDYQRSLFRVWNDIFSLPRLKREVPTNPHECQHNTESANGNLFTKEELKDKIYSDPTTLASRFQNILRVVQSCGEYDKLTLGWFENYLNVKIKHTHLEPITKALEWATLSDILQKEIAHSQLWILLSYVSFSFVVFHFLFASNSWHRLQYPHRYHEFQTKQTHSKNILDVMISGMSLQTRLYSPKMCLVLDILPYLTSILQPKLRPLSMQLFSDKEKQELNQVVDNMINFNLTYVQEKTLDGQYDFSLDPNIEDIVLFPNMPQRSIITYPIKQLIAREVELEKIKRSENYFSSQHNSNEKGTGKTSDVRGNEKMGSSSADKPKNDKILTIPNHLQTLQGTINSNNQIKHNKFVKMVPGIANKVNTIVAKDTSSTNNILTSDIWYKFKEGYSNAVRRNVKIKSFIT